ncbi:hypothetical protein GQ42DRAFT_157664 [Ramicandelaber brevisporus]|nr:hypothetical protein GQ42DRAFT_157664 [Ramicandelaber brevisporus]
MTSDVAKPTHVLLRDDAADTWLSPHVHYVYAGEPDPDLSTFSSDKQQPPQVIAVDAVETVLHNGDDDKHGAIIGYGQVEILYDALPSTADFFVTSIEHIRLDAYNQTPSTLTPASDNNINTSDDAGKDDKDDVETVLVIHGMAKDNGEIAARGQAIARGDFGSVGDNDSARDAAHGSAAGDEDRPLEAIMEIEDFLETVINRSNVVCDAIE